MSPKKTPVTEEKARRWTDLYRAGWSFARIGRVVRKMLGKDTSEALAAARKEVASRLLERHFREMESAAAVLLRTVAPPSLRDSLFLEAADLDSLLHDRLEAWWLRMGQIYLPDSGPDEIDRRRARRQAVALLDALYEHQPQVRSLIGEWGRCTERYHTIWVDMEKRAQMEGFDGSRARTLVEESLLKYRGGGSGGEAAAKPLSRRADSDTAQAWASGNRRFQAGLRDLAEHLECMERVFTRLEELLDSGPMHRALLGTRCSLCPA